MGQVTCPGSILWVCEGNSLRDTTPVSKGTPFFAPISLKPTCQGHQLPNRQQKQTKTRAQVSITCPCCTRLRLRLRLPRPSEGPPPPCEGPSEGCRGPGRQKAPAKLESTARPMARNKGKLRPRPLRLRTRARGGREKPRSPGPRTPAGETKRSTETRKEGPEGDAAQDLWENRQSSLQTIPWKLPDFLWKTWFHLDRPCERLRKIPLARRAWRYQCNMLRILRTLGLMYQNTLRGSPSPMYLSPFGTLLEPRGQRGLTKTQLSLGQSSGGCKEQIRRRPKENPGTGCKFECGKLWWTSCRSGFISTKDV